MAVNSHNMEDISHKMAVNSRDSTGLHSEEEKASTRMIDIYYVYDAETTYMMQKYIQRIWRSIHAAETALLARQ
jgi:hypothetical protein